MVKILLSQEIHKDAIEFMKSRDFEIQISPNPKDEIVRKYAIDADAMIVRTATKLSRDTIFAAKKLKIIARTGAGVDNVDVNAASERNILVCNTPEANIDSVVEHTIAFIFALSKYLFKMDTAVRENNFIIRNSYLPIDLQGKVLGIIGFGKIGRKVAEKCCKCFNMKIFYYDKFLPDDVHVDFPCKRIKDFYEIFLISDFVSVHIPYTEENHNIINKEILKNMKKDAFIINTSRGGIIDENALADVLSENKISGAALDVFENEPPKPDNPILKLNNIILTPHSAALTIESSRRMAMHAAECVVDALEGRKPKWIYNKDKIKFIV
ncbi:MAG: hydroxyacid dehydrogenase [Actinobacteria bacterium]|nr:hydroxyacid dehydrogenase [Cyanobacteriota bacterium]MCL5771001.1 hydroxyacid dehydrogenase [Actinomycetota bacterium]